jgi:hypothetical protein
LNVVGRVETNDIKFTSGTALFQGSNFVLNGNQNINQSPSLNAIIEVSRGVSANAIIRYNETIDRWEFTHDGTNYSTFNAISERANNISGGATNRIAFQTATNATGFVVAPVTANYFLQWTGTAFTWADVPSADLTNLNATNLTSGLLPTARVSKVNADGTRRVYPMHTNGDAAFATSAGSATTATSATTAGSTANVTAGGTVSTGTAGSDTVTSLTSFGRGSIFGNWWCRSGGTTTSKTDASNLAALKVTGDAAVSGDVWSTIFRGVATSAQYADLAEKYLADQEYPVGTLLMIGGEKEVTSAIKGKTHSVIGVVSENPAYLMNSELQEGVNVALKGRIPVRVIGTCSKGDLLTISAESGIMCVSSVNEMPIRIIALENKTDSEEGLIEAALL